MSDRYIWVGEIIDGVDGMINLDGEETAGRMNELDRENADLRRQLAEAYERCIAAMWSVVMGKASPDTRTALRICRKLWMQTRS